MKEISPSEQESQETELVETGLDESDLRSISAAYRGVNGEETLRSDVSFSVRTSKSNRAQILFNKPSALDLGEVFAVQVNWGRK